jgi:hypothetical protein
MALIIKRFKTTLKGHKEYPNKNKTKGKCSCFKCGKTGHFIAQCPNNENDQGQERHGKKKKKSYRKAKGEAHLGKEWDSDCSSSDSDDEGLAASAFNKSSLFPNERHTCLMAKEKKVSVRETPEYTTSSDDDSSNDEVDYSSLFKGLDRAKVEKINELIGALNEKDRLLEKQEDILYEEHDKFVSVQKSLALETKRNEKLSSELSACHESISSLKILNDDLNAKLEEVNKSSSCVEHVVICNRCKDFDVNSCDEHLISIAKLNNEVASLNAQLKTCKIDQKCHAYIYDRKFSRNAHYNRSYDHDAFNSHAIFASSSTFVHGRSRPRKNHVVHHVPRRMCNEPSTICHACNTSFVLSCKNEKVVARKLGAKCKGDKTCIWVPKVIVTNLVGPNKSWVPKTQV